MNAKAARELDRGRKPRRGVSWRSRPIRPVLASGLYALAVPLVLTASLTTSPVSAQSAVATSSEPAEPSAPVAVIVRAEKAVADAEVAVAAAGGTSGRRLGIINGVAAAVPASQLASLRQAPGVHSVTVDVTVDMADAETRSYSGDPGSMFTMTQQATGAAQMWNNGITGKGVDVALIDTGVVSVNGLQTPGKVTYGPDLSSEADYCTRTGCVPSPYRHLDTYGHGTHMAGIIAGRDNAAPAVVRGGDTDNFLGMAPDAGIVSVKVADATGATDVSQVIAGIDWVVEHRRANGMNIKVLNLSFGTDGVQNYQLDPLAYAAEVAWRKGIVVVVAAGNGGYGSAKLNNPAYDPYVIAVGGSDGLDTISRADDVIPAWSSTGDGVRNPDLVAPGASVLSLRDPGSFVDEAYPNARAGSRLFRGSGTSQASAVVAGGAALLVQQHPGITPDQVKAVLMRSAKALPSADPIAQGQGALDLEKARTAWVPNTTQNWPLATGTGSLERARGSHHITDNGATLAGEVDILGYSWNANSWAAAALGERVWSGGTWSGGSFSGGSWNGHLWGGLASNGSSSWLGRSWSGRSWSGGFWTGRSWSGRSWSTGTWGDPAGSSSP